MLSQCEGKTGNEAQSCDHGADAGLVCNIPERKDTCSEVKVSICVSQYDLPCSIIPEAVG